MLRLSIFWSIPCLDLRGVSRDSHAHSARLRYSPKGCGHRTTQTDRVPTLDLRGVGIDSHGHSARLRYSPKGCGHCTVQTGKILTTSMQASIINPATKILLVIFSTTSLFSFYGEKNTFLVVDGPNSILQENIQIHMDLWDS